MRSWRKRNGAGHTDDDASVLSLSLAASLLRGGAVRRIQGMSWQPSLIIVRGDARDRDWTGMDRTGID